MITSEKAANFFIELANKQDDDFITNLKLNKLLFYAQGAFLSRTGKPLFEDKTEVWAHDPIIPAIYRKYQAFGSNPIPFDDRDSVKTDDFTSEELDTLLDVAQEFEQYTNSVPETPWSQWDTGTSIPHETIQTFFLENPIPRFKISDRCATVYALPADWYDPAEDNEWERYFS